MAWTSEDWERAQRKYRAAYGARLDAVRAVTYLEPDVRDRLDEAAGEAGRALNESAARLGPPELPGYEARDERLAGNALGRVDEFIGRFRVADTQLRRNATPEDMELLLAAGWRDALDGIREAGGRALEQAPISVPGRRRAPTRRRSMPWGILLALGGLLLSMRRR